MKQFNKTSALRKIKFQKNKNTYIKRLSISLSCLILLFVVILFTFARFEASSDEYTMINGKMGEYINENCTYNNGQVWNYSYTGSSQTFATPCSGVYKVELWGAQGGSSEGNHTGELGAYTSGNIELYRGDALYVYVGQGEAEKNVAAFNGTTNSSAGGNPGGGATDVRLVYGNGTWNNENSLRSRIMVAGGGGSSQGGKFGGAAGGLIGYSSSRSGYTNTGGTQISGGVYYSNSAAANGGFGIGSTTGATGGSGWYGGSGAAHAAGSGAGGSSYISGYTGCVAVTSTSNSSPKSGCTTATSNNECSISPYGYKFENGVMIDGEGCNWSTRSATNCGSNQIQPNGTKAVGHSGHGYARITLVSKNNFYNMKEKQNHFVNKEWQFEYTGSLSSFTAPCKGKYKIELWGSEGNTSFDGSGGKGGYTSGEIQLDNNYTIYVNVGSKGSYSSGGYNGGGIAHKNNGTFCGAAGGGATDIRLVNGAWNNFNSLKSRIMVAAAGGGAGGAETENRYSQYFTTPGDAGGLSGYASNGSTSYKPSVGGTQTTGGYNTINVNVTDTYGSFGYGPQTDDNSCCGAGGGSGYYGGGGGCGTSASGGSSFISGYSGCKAITESSTASNIVHSSNANHYSGKIFTNGIMIDGKGCNWSTGSATNCGANQPQPSGTNAAGHSGNGYARITYISK